MTAPFSIAGRPIGPGYPVYVIAELSANHGQHEDAAIELVHAAKAAGADAVKLQTYTPDTMTIDCDAAPFRLPARPAERNGPRTPGSRPGISLESRS